MDKFQYFAMYYPFGVRVKNKTTEMPLTGYYLNELDDPQVFFDDTYKLILKPVSEIRNLDMSDIEKEGLIAKINGSKLKENKRLDLIGTIEFSDMLILLENNIDVFNLVESNMAIYE